MSSALSLRYMSDNWGVHSDTAQLHLRCSLSDRDRYIEPTIRWYHQTAADFYTPFILVTAKPTTGNEASDSRLGAFHALTYGVKYAQKLPGLEAAPNPNSASAQSIINRHSMREWRCPPACRGSICIPI